MRDLIALALLAIAFPVALVGVPFYLFARRRHQVSRVSAAVGAAALSVLSLGLGLWATNECMLSNFARQKLPTMLTPAELATVRGNGLFCSTTFSFERRGKAASALVVDGWRGARIYVADDTGP